jgi:hypothetical protein
LRWWVSSTRRHHADQPGRSGEVSGKAFAYERIVAIGQQGNEQIDASASPGQRSR